MAQRPSALKHLASITTPEKLYSVLRRNKCLTDEALNDRARIINTIKIIIEEQAKKERESFLRNQRLEREEPIIGEANLSDRIANFLDQYLNEKGTEIFFKKSQLTRWQIIKYKYL